MKKLFLALAIAALAAACSEVSNPISPTRLEGGAGSAAATVFPEQEHGGRLLTATMTGAAEAPGPGDPDGSGSARITLNPGQEEVCFALEVSGIEPATASHIHVAPPGEPGPVVVTLVPPTSGSSSGCVSADRDLIRDILRNPEGYYVNVHNAAFPAGAVRGQLSK